MRIEIKNLVREFGKTRAVDGISFEFNSGDIFGFVGPNGSGKTTTMRIISTLDEPTSGDILLDGVSLVDYPEQARSNIGFMPDSLPAHSDITIEEYVDFFARTYGLRGKTRRLSVEGVIEFTGLGDIRWKMLNSLSKGMKQRVSLARALINDPGVLIMDEPAAGLDPRARVELRELLKVLRGQGKAVLISSHILTELAEVCTGAIIIEQGKILRAGDIQSLADGHTNGKYTDIFVQAIGIEPELLAQLAMEAPAVTRATVYSNVTTGVRITAETGDENMVVILKFLMERGIQVIEFTPKRAGLEDLFLAITEGKVQ